MQTKLPLFLKWGIEFGDVYEVPERAAREVFYADRLELEQEIMRRRDGWGDEDEFEKPPMAAGDASRCGGQAHAPASERKGNRILPLRTD